MFSKINGYFLSYDAKVIVFVENSVKIYVKDFF